MRLEGQQKMGYFRTPDRIVDLLRGRFHFPEKPFAVLDPCCGEGLALERLLEGTGGVSYGIELDDTRAEESRVRLNHVLHSPIEECQIGHKAFSMIWLNPPYDWDARDDEDSKCERKELTFLKRSIPWLCPEGVLAFLIPETVWNERLQRLVTANFDQVDVWKFPEPEYQAYKQIVILGKRKAESVIPQPSTNKNQTISYSIPISNPHVKVFRSLRVDQAEVEHLIEQSPIWRKFLEESGHASQEGKVYRPPLPLRSGHLSLTLASGILDGVVGNNGDSHVIKGKVVKSSVATSEIKVSEDGERSWTVTRELDTYNVSIKLVDATGQIREVR